MGADVCRSLLRVLIGQVPRSEGASLVLEVLRQFSECE